jgi:hypothetical protein
LLHLQVDTVNQRLGFQDKELVDDDSMVAEHGIVANSRLWLINTGEHVNRDIAGRDSFQYVLTFRKLLLLVCEYSFSL